MTDCSNYCQSAQQDRDYCRLHNGCHEGYRQACPFEHSFHSRGGWNINSDAELGILIKCNGSIEFRIRCDGCGRESSGIPKIIVNKLISAGMVVCWTRVQSSGTVCTVTGCDRTDVEYHHFAPVNTFPDADNWPYLPLCVMHHHYWHQTMDGYRWNAKTASFELQP